jgi:hypothetical protein
VITPTATTFVVAAIVAIPSVITVMMALEML